MGCNFQYKPKRAVTLSPSRGDSITGESTGRSYKEIMLEEELKKEEKAILRKINETSDDNSSIITNEPKQQRRKRRWDEPNETPVRSDWDNVDHKTSLPSSSSRWNETPQISSVAEGKTTRNRWDETPMISDTVVDPSNISVTKKRLQIINFNNSIGISVNFTLL